LKLDEHHARLGCVEKLHPNHGIRVGGKVDFKALKMNGFDLPCYLFGCGTLSQQFA